MKMILGDDDTVGCICSGSPGQLALRQAERHAVATSFPIEGLQRDEAGTVTLLILKPRRSRLKKN